MEFKKHRQAVILESIRELKPPSHISRPGLFSDAKAVRALNKNLKQAEERVKLLKDRLSKVFERPAIYDPVYKVCQRVFHKNDELNLSRNKKIRYAIRRKAFRRFLLGCPPRKQSDTSMGDAINWEWIVHCAQRGQPEIVIVSRDSDYGVLFNNKAYANDHLRQEFSEHVSRKRKILLYNRLSDALKHFKITITLQEEEEENRLIQSSESKAEQETSIREVGELWRLLAKSAKSPANSSDE